jgi:hypothetical protein
VERPAPFAAAGARRKPSDQGEAPGGGDRPDAATPQDEITSALTVAAWAGIDAERFWRLTPWLLQREAEIALGRQRRHYNLTMAAAWHAGMLPRLKDPPPLAKLLLQDAKPSSRPGVEDKAKMDRLRAWMRAMPTPHEEDEGA